MLAPDAPLYPPSPTAVPADFTRATGRYGWLVAATVGSIVVFVGFYLLLLAGACTLVWLTLTRHFDDYNLWLGLFHLGGVVGAIMLVVFLVKAVLKRRPDSGDEGRISLTAAGHPALFAFVYRLCAEVGAERPKHIYLSGDVNAAVFYDSAWRSLVWPTRKNLVIGLGLVNGLNLSEFKAVLAHEFGHFAQRSMRLGSYVHTASGVLHDTVYARDQWDELLARWRGLDLRVSAVAWLITGLVWGVRKLLELAYQGIHLVHASLSREMEFQADRVAVRFAGSQAMCDVLYQLGPATQALQAATRQLSLALEHQLATDDIFYHQQQYLREQLAARPVPAPAAPGQPLRRFAPDEVSIVAMYASHPPDYLREEAAQRVPVPGPHDERSPWLLFGNPAELRRQLTRRMYPEAAPGQEPRVQPAAEVEAFLAAERAALEYSDLYAGTYDYRLQTLLPPDELPALADRTPLPPGTLAEARAALFGPELRQRTEAYHARQTDLQKLALFEQKLTKDRSFVVAGTTYPAAEAPAVAARLRREDEELDAWVEHFDHQVLAVHWRLLAHQPAEVQAGWQARYDFHYGILRALLAVRGALQTSQLTLNEVSQAGNLTEQQVSAYRFRFEQSRLDLQDALIRTKQVPMLPLTHLADFATLYDYLMPEQLLPPPAQFDGDWVNNFFGLANFVEERLRRVYFKNLGVRLRLEENLTPCPPKNA